MKYQALLAIGVLAALTGCNRQESAAAAVVPPPSDATKLATAGDGSFLNLNGRIVTTRPDSFVLDYGTGNITVEMDDWDVFPEGSLLLPGERAVVSGRFDKDLFENRKIEAASVYLPNQGTAYFANPADEESAVAAQMMVSRPDLATVSGHVMAVKDNQFTLGGTEGGLVRVDTSEMSNDPLDDEGYPRIHIGDRVYVWGRLSLDGANSQIVADQLVDMSADAGPAPAKVG